MFLSIFAMVSGSIFALYSCNKDDDETLFENISKNNYHSSSADFDMNNEELVNQCDISDFSAKESVEIRLRFVWDGWGRKKYDCEKGAGLCRFRIETAAIEVDLNRGDHYYSVPIHHNRDSYYVNLPIDEKVIFENYDKLFYIDEDLYAKAPDGSIYKLPAGVYCMDKSIGKLGGYKLPLQIVKNMNYEQ